MRADSSLRLFAHIAARPEGDLDLVRAALLLGEHEYPELDVSACLDRFDELGEVAHMRLVAARPPAPRLPRLRDDVEVLLRLFYGELGFAGNTEHYYDPKNSFLNEVLERKVGIPISLAVVLVAVARRAGLDARGVGFPGHFLVRFDDERDAPVFVDPFFGHLLDDEALELLAERASGQCGPVDPRVLEPASKASTLVRMLNNLRGIYSAREEHARLRCVLERLEVLAPSTDLRRQIEALGGGSNPPPRSRPSPLH